MNLVREANKTFGFQSASLNALPAEQTSPLKDFNYAHPEIYGRTPYTLRRIVSE